MNIFIDSNILIDHLRGNKKAKFFFKKIIKKNNNLYITAMNRVEIIFFMRKNEKTETLKFLSQFKTIPLTEDIVDLAGEYYRNLNKSHGTDIVDALLIATANKITGKIYTLNKKHFPVKNISIEKPY
jgi:hypothetical protein